MTPQELKNSILQLAIQGKLVEQRPEEGTAAELLEKIFAAKNAKAAKKNLTRRRRAAEATKESRLASNVSRPVEDTPFDIPESWGWVRLGEIGSWASGATPSRTHNEYYGGSIPWLKTGDLTDGYVSSIPESITELALEKNSVRLNPVGSVLMAMYGATIGKLGILQIAATTNQACCACIPYDGVWNKYLFYYLMARRKAFIKMGEGGAQPNISKEKIVNVPIPLPPLAEQKRIVAKIEELLPLIDRYEKAWSRLEDFNKRFPVDMQKSLLQLAIQGKLVEQRPEEGTAAELLEKIFAAKNAKGVKKNLTQSRRARGEKATAAPSVSPRDKIPDDEKPFDIPESWEWVRLGELCSIATGRRDANFGSPDGKYNFFTCAKKPTKCHSFSFTGESLLLAGNGDIGNITYFWGQFEAYQRTYVLQPYLEGSYLIYLYYHLQSNWVQYNTGMIYGTAIPYIRLGNVQNYLVALPPLAEQKRIVAKLEEFLPLCERLK